jgi:hypothetical protein
MAEANDRTTRGADTRLPLAASVLIVTAALVVPASALAGPAVDEYTLDLPDAKGKVESPETSPVANPAGLPPRVVSRLSRNPSGKALATIATASSLGAPVEYKGGVVDSKGSAPTLPGDQPSAPAAFGSSLDDPAAIGLIALLLTIGGGMFLVRRRAKT